MIKKKKKKKKNYSPCFSPFAFGRQTFSLVCRRGNEEEETKREKEKVGKKETNKMK